VLRADDRDLVDPREVGEGDDEQRSGARERDERGTRARRILDAERGPAATGLTAC
jgi:hypothetical protein